MWFWMLGNSGSTKCVRIMETDDVFEMRMTSKFWFKSGPDCSCQGSNAAEVWSRLQLSRQQCSWSPVQIAAVKAAMQLQPRLSQAGDVGHKWLHSWKAIMSYSRFKNWLLFKAVMSYSLFKNRLLFKVCKCIPPPVTRAIIKDHLFWLFLRLTTSLPSHWWHCLPWGALYFCFWYNTLYVWELG